MKCPECGARAEPKMSDGADPKPMVRWTAGTVTGIVICTECDRESLIVGQ